MLVGGKLALSTGWVTGEAVEVYLVPLYGDAADNYGGALGATGLIGINSPETAGTDFENLNLIPLTSIRTPVASLHYHWGQVSVAGAMGSLMAPDDFLLMFHTRTTSGTIASSGNELFYQALTY